MATKLIAMLLVTVLGMVKAVYGSGIENGWSISTVAYGPYTTGVCAVIYALGKLYCIRWCEVRGGGVIQKLLEWIFVPAMAVLIPLGFLQWAPSSVPWLAAVVAIFFLHDGNRVVHKFLQEKAPMHESERILYLHFPPRDGIDMLPMDVVFFLTIGVGCVALGGFGQ